MKTPVLAEKLSLSRNNLIVNQNEDIYLKAIVFPDNTSDKSITWITSDSKIATVASNGKVTTHAPGKVTITAKSNSNNKLVEKCNFIVNFADVLDKKSWYYEPVNWAVKNKVTTGNGGYFFPDNICNREQIITFFWRLAGEPVAKKETTFSDVKDPNRFSYKAIQWGQENKIITGKSGKYYPYDACTREHVILMIWRLAGSPEPKGKSRFKDVTNEKQLTYKAICWAHENNITTGKDGYFGPYSKCTRKEAVTFIYRFSKIFNCK